ncbi:MAG: hypothetical protein ABIG67_05815 [Pseudomonadota bacterium]
MRLPITLVLIITVLIAMPVAWFWPSRVVVACPGVVAPEIIKQAHRYHGILYSEADEYGYRYFWRDGRKCRLLSKRFLKTKGWKNET